MMVKSQVDMDKIVNHLKAIDKQDMNNIALTIMGFGSMMCAYYGQQIYIRYDKKDLKLVTPPIIERILTHASTGMPAIHQLMQAGAVILALREKLKVQFTEIRLDEEKIARIKARKLLPDQQATAVQESYVRVINQMEAELSVKKASMEYPLYLLNMLIIGAGLLTAGYTMWMGNNPDVAKQIISSFEKVSIRVIDESSELLDKTGEALGDIIWTWLPWK